MTPDLRQILSLYVFNEEELNTLKKNSASGLQHGILGAIPAANKNTVPVLCELKSFPYYPGR